MNKLIALIPLFSIIWAGLFADCTVCCQPSDSFALEFLKDYPIKIDGGCSFYTYQSIKVGTFHKEIFIVSATQNAFFKTRGAFEIMSQRRRTWKPDGYTDYFENENYKVVLDVKKVRKINEYQTQVSGSLKITGKSVNKTLSIHGLNEDFEVNKPHVSRKRQS